MSLARSRSARINRSAEIRLLYCSESQKNPDQIGLGNPDRRVSSDLLVDEPPARLTGQHLKKPRRSVFDVEPKLFYPASQSADTNPLPFPRIGRNFSVAKPGADYLTIVERRRLRLRHNQFPHAISNADARVCWFSRRLVPEPFQ